MIFFARGNKYQAICLITGLLITALFAVSCEENNLLNNNDQELRLEDNSTEDKISITYLLPEPSIKTGSSPTYYRVIIEGLENRYKSGEPIIPYIPIVIAVPQGKEIIDIEVITTEEVILGEYLLEPAEEPISPGDEPPETEPDPSIYQSDSHYPEKIMSKLQQQSKSGISLVALSLYPVTYYPSQNKISYYQSLTIEAQLAVKPLENGILPSDSDLEIIKKIVDNPSALETYQ